LAYGFICFFSLIRNRFLKVIKDYFITLCDLCVIFASFAVKQKFTLTTKNTKVNTKSTKDVSGNLFGADKINNFLKTDNESSHNYKIFISFAPVF